jgi:hypothetical protein
MPLYAKSLAERRRVICRIPKIIPKIAKNIPKNQPGGMEPTRGKDRSDSTPNDRLVMAKARDRFLLESV